MRRERLIRSNWVLQQVQLCHKLFKCIPPALRFVSSFPSSDNPVFSLLYILKSSFNSWNAASVVLGSLPWRGPNSWIFPRTDPSSLKCAYFERHFDPDFCFYILIRENSFNAGNKIITVSFHTVWGKSAVTEHYHHYVNIPTVLFTLLRHSVHVLN